MSHRDGGAQSVTLTVPGNLLLLGEYAVLEEGGLGVTMALERRIVVTAERAQGLEIEGSWGTDAVRWSEAHPESSPLFAEVVRTCRRYLAGAAAAPVRPGLAAQPAGRVRIDSSAFFLSPERKSGFGSSAAVTVGLAWAILVLAGLDPEVIRGAVPELALQAHRAAQGGGSGYDVLTSAYGGTGLFTGGAAPSWEPRVLPWLPPLYLVRGPRSVSTAPAVERYRVWRGANPAEAQGFLRRSNQAVLEFVGAGSWREAEGAFARSREEGLRLGELIGVPAALELPAHMGGAPFKALGAGNELGVVAPPEGAASRSLSPGLEPLVPAREGVQWQL